jgi:hypothetical protein
VSSREQKFLKKERGKKQVQAVTLSRETKSKKNRDKKNI